MALGAMVVAAYYHGLRDEEIVQLIAENPYLQFFLGMMAYSTQPPFRAATIKRFRKRVPA